MQLAVWNIRCSPVLLFGLFHLCEHWCLQCLHFVVKVAWTGGSRCVMGPITEAESVNMATGSLQSLQAHPTASKPGICKWGETISKPVPCQMGRGTKGKHHLTFSTIWLVMSKWFWDQTPIGTFPPRPPGLWNGREKGETASFLFSITTGCLFPPAEMLLLSPAFILKLNSSHPLDNSLRQAKSQGGPGWKYQPAGIQGMRPQAPSASPRSRAHRRWLRHWDEAYCLGTGAFLCSYKMTSKGRSVNAINIGSVPHWAPVPRCFFSNGQEQTQEKIRPNGISWINNLPT